MCLSDQEEASKEHKGKLEKWSASAQTRHILSTVFEIIKMLPTYVEDN